MIGRTALQGGGQFGVHDALDRRLLDAAGPSRIVVLPPDIPTDRARR
jgi:hypothetical protein